jgi:hypothetical protein
VGVRSVIAIVVAAGLALSAAACAGSRGGHVAQLGDTATHSSRSSSTASDGSSQAQSESEYVNFAKCMRSRGVIDFPDPITGSGGHPGFHLRGGSNTDLNVNNPAFHRGVDACQHILGHKFEFIFGPDGVGKGT